MEEQLGGSTIMDGVVASRAATYLASAMVMVCDGANDDSDFLIGSFLDTSACVAKSL